MNPNMAALRSVILFHIVFGFLHHSLGLISDYKLCGDPECGSMISRVQAQRDHSAKDCRFLNFKKGEMITVYYKLTGKRNDLWAGSIEKLSGLFPKDAIKVDQLFIDEKKEIQVPTQEYDFICFDENGLVIEHITEFDDLEDLTQETQETDINEIHDKPADREESEPSKISVQDVSDQNSPKTTEKGGSSWIGSAVSGWFGRNEQSNDEPQDESIEESFKSRKIVMDIEESQLEEKTNSGTFGWIRGELTNAFGFGNKDLKTDTQDNIENPTNDKDTSSQQSSSWISMGKDVLGFSEDDTKSEAEMKDENTHMEDQSIHNPSENLDVDDKIQRDKNNPDDSVENEDGPMENMRSDNEKVEEQAGWYGNMYNRITNLYKEEETKQDEDDGGKDSLSEEGSPGFATNTENIETKESESSSQSLFSVSGLRSVLKLPFQADTVVKKDEEKTAKEEDPDKEDFDEEQNNSQEQEEQMLTDIDEQDSNPIDNVLSKTQSLSDKTKDNIAFDSTEKSNMTEDSTDSQIIENKSAGNLNEDVKSAKNADVLAGEVEQDMKDVRNDEEKTAKEVDSGKEDFLEQQKMKKEEMSDVDEQKSTPKDADLISKTQALSDEKMTLKDSVASDDIREIDGFSQESNTQNDDDVKSANNLINEVITDLSDGISEDKLTQRLSDQDNLDTNKKQISDYDKISTDTVTVADTSTLPETDIHNEVHYQKTQESNVSDLYIDSHIETLTISESVNADMNPELTVDALSEYINEKKIDDQGTLKEDGELIMDNNAELLMDRNDKLIVARKDELVVDKKDELVVDKKDELVVDKKDELVVDRNDELFVGKKDELVVDKKDELVVERNDKLVVDRNDELVVDKKDELVVDKKDELVVDRNDELVVDKKDELVVDRNDELVVDKKDELVVDRNDELVVDKKDELVVDKKDKLVVDKKDKLVAERNDNLVVDKKDELVVDKKDELVVERNDKLVVDKNDELVMDKIDDLVVDKKDELVVDRNDELVVDKKDELVVDKKDKLVVDRNDELVVNKKDELVVDKKDELVVDKNYELVMDRNGKLVMDRNYEVLSKDITFHEEKISDSEDLATEMSKKCKLDANRSPLDDGTSQIPTLRTDELSVISEENLHTDLESNPALNATNDDMDNTSGLHDVLLEIQKSGISIVKDTDSEGEYADKVVVNGKQKELGSISEPTENYFETKELKGDTESTNEILIDETNTKSPSTNMSDESADSKDGGHEDPGDYTISKETKLTDEFFLENNPVQDGNINNMLDQNQSVEHKEETDTANMEDPPDSESVTKREESDTGATWDQSDNSDKAVQSEDKEERGDEKRPGRSEIQEQITFNQSTETSKEYTNLYPHLSEQNIQDLLDLFGDHKLSWLDSKIGNTDAGQDNKDLEELRDFEQLLEYHMKMNIKLGHIHQDTGFPGKNIFKEYSALQKMFTLLSTLREKYAPVITEVSVESPGISEDGCVHEACLDVNKNTLISSTELKNNQVTEDRSDKNDLSDPQNEPVTEEKYLSTDRANVEGVQTDEQEIRKNEDWISSETKKTTSQNDGLIISEEHVESQNGEGQFYQMAVFVEVTINEIASIVDKVGLHVKYV